MEFDLYIAARIADRYVELCESIGVEPADRVGLMMDLDYTCDVCPLDLQALLDANDGDFAHDVGGILRHFNRQTRQIDGGFWPRFASN